jgi:hypothetical protein
VELEFIGFLADRAQRHRRRGCSATSPRSRSGVACRSRRGATPGDTTSRRPRRASAGLSKPSAAIHRPSPKSLVAASSPVSLREHVFASITTSRSRCEPPEQTASLRSRSAPSAAGTCDAASLRTPPDAVGSSGDPCNAASKPSGPSDPRTSRRIPCTRARAAADDASQAPFLSQPHADKRGNSSEPPRQLPSRKANRTTHTTSEAAAVRAEDPSTVRDRHCT